MSGKSNKLMYKKRRLCGYNIWHRETLQSADPSNDLGELNKVSGERWQALSQEEREVYNKRAVEEASSTTNVETKQILSQLAKLSNSIKDNLGGELFFTLVKNDEHFIGGTEKGVSFLKNEAAWVPYSFIGYLCNPVGNTQNCENKTIDQMRQEVEQIFNKHYGEVTGNSTSRVPYSKLKKIGVTVDGLPEGIVFKHPSSYGQRHLQQIIATKNDIKFNVPQDLPCHSNPPSLIAAHTNPPTLPAADANPPTLPTAHINPPTLPADANPTTVQQKFDIEIPLVNSSPSAATTGTVVLLSEHGLPVGMGKVCPENVIHGHEIPNNHIKVMIDYIKPGIKPPFQMPFDDDELCTAQFTVWPKHCTKSAK